METIVQTDIVTALACGYISLCVLACRTEMRFVWRICTAVSAILQRQRETEVLNEWIATTRSPLYRVLTPVLLFSLSFFRLPVLLVQSRGKFLFFILSPPTPDSEEGQRIVWSVAAARVQSMLNKK